MPRHAWEDPDEGWVYETPALTVHPEDREVVAEIYGPDGEVISMLLDRPVMPIGFAAEPKEPQWWIRD